jgi:putative tricarboxylic transport membrane protein
MTPTLNSVVTTPLQQKIPVMYPSADLTPLALMTIDPFLLWVNPDQVQDLGGLREGLQGGIASPRSAPGRARKTRFRST